jgi:phospholipase D1/2
MQDGSPATEQVYIHSKLMLVDDNVALVGSANINDRSLLGHRDSELATVIEDRTKVKVRFDGQDHSVSECVHELRVKCFEQIFGLNRYQVLDPLKPEMWLSIDFNAGVDSA